MVPYHPLGRGSCCAHTQRALQPRPLTARPALAALRHSQSARWRCHIPVALSLYGRSELSPILVATQGSGGLSQPARTSEEKMIRSSLARLRRAALHPATLSTAGTVGLGLARRALAKAPLPPMARLVARAGLVATEFVVAELIRRRHAASP